MWPLELSHVVTSNKSNIQRTCVREMLSSTLQKDSLAECESPEMKSKFLNFGFKLENCESSNKNKNDFNFCH
jgi:hypothetical protein